MASLAADNVVDDIVQGLFVRDDLSVGRSDKGRNSEEGLVANTLLLVLAKEVRHQHVEALLQVNLDLVLIHGLNELRDSVDGLLRLGSVVIRLGRDSLVVLEDFH